MSTTQALTFKTILKRLFRGPAIVVIGGTWKTGKTDFSLRISELLFELELISEAASNINTQGHYPQISDTISLSQWLYGSKKNKLYIFDEASEHLPNTRGMSGKSVGIKGLIPQISKAHGRLIIVGHDIEKVDKEAYNPTWCRAVFMKPNKPFQYAPCYVYSQLFPRPIRLAEIQQTKITFDPYDLAPFTERPAAQVYFKDEDKQKLWRWANGESAGSIGLHPMQLNRLTRKYIKNTLESTVTSHT